MALGDDFTKYSGIFNGQPCICKKNQLFCFWHIICAYFGGTL